jgi:hypothetical protein
VNKIFKYFEKTGENKVRHLMMSDMEMGMDMIPEKLLNYIVKEKTIQDCGKMQGMFEKNMPHYAERVKAKKEFYDSIRVKLGLTEDDE